MIHLEGAGTPGQTPAATVNITSTPSTDQVPKSLLMTCQVLLTGPTGRTLRVRALLDSGATMSLITTKTMNALALKKSPTFVSITGVQNTESGHAHCLTNFILSPPHNPGLSYQVVAAAVPEVTCDLPQGAAHSVKKLPHLQGLPLADPDFHVPGKIDLVLVENILGKLVPSRDDKVGPEGTPTAVKTVFGWAIRGEYSGAEQQAAGQAAIHTVVTTLVDAPTKALTKFWEVENSTCQHLHPRRVESERTLFQDSHVYSFCRQVHGLPSEERRST